jgi:hypothetical protein
MAACHVLPPLLSPGGADWQQLAEGFVARALVMGADGQVSGMGGGGRRGRGQQEAGAGRGREGNGG